MWHFGLWPLTSAVTQPQESANISTLYDKFEFQRNLFTILLYRKIARYIFILVFTVYVCALEMVTVIRKTGFNVTIYEYNIWHWCFLLNIN